MTDGRWFYGGAMLLLLMFVLGFHAIPRVLDHASPLAGFFLGLAYAALWLGPIVAGAFRKP